MNSSINLPVLEINVKIDPSKANQNQSEANRKMGSLEGHRLSQNTINPDQETTISNKSKEIFVNTNNEIFINTANSVRKISFGEHTITFEKHPPKIKNLALAGGGPKGWVYPAYIKALDEKIDLIKNLEKISGSSAGSMMAFMLCSGMDITSIADYVNKKDIIEQMKGRYKSDNIETGFGLLEAGNLVAGLKEATIRSVCDYLRKVDLDKIIDEDNFTSKNISPENLNTFKSKAQNVNGFSDGLTFLDLKILNILNPEKFKLLYATGYNKTDNQACYFDADTTPNMYCHDAVRISMALPIIVKEVKMRNKNNESKTYVDGGVFSNLPYEAFDSERNYKNVNAKETLGLAFDKGGTLERINFGIGAYKESIKKQRNFLRLLLN